MLKFAQKLRANRNLLKNLIVRDLKHRYVGSIGGFLWSVIHPIVLLVCYTFVVGIVFGMRPGSQFSTDSLAVFVLSGLLPWMLFTDTVSRNCSVISDNAPLITKTVIPAEILPLSVTISNLIHHLIGMAILLAVMLVFYNIHLSALWILLYMFMLLLLAQGIGWMVASLHVFIKDTIQAVQIVLMLWFYFTPILYTVESLPPKFQLLTAFNPMALIVTGYRNSLLHGSQPAGLNIAIVFAASIIIFVVGALFFRQAKPAFPDVL